MTTLTVTLRSTDDIAATLKAAQRFWDGRVSITPDPVESRRFAVSGIEADVRDFVGWVDQVGLAATIRPQQP